MDRSVFYIVIADRNTNVLEFLRREFLKDGYRVQIAKDAFDLCNILRSTDTPDLVVLDPDLPYMDDFALHELIQWQKLGLPIIMHSLYNERVTHPLVEHAKAFLKKSGDPGSLKLAVSGALKGLYPSALQNDEP